MTVERRKESAAGEEGGELGGEGGWEGSFRRSWAVAGFEVDGCVEGDARIAP